MNPTRNTLPEKTRAQVAQLLNARLAEAIDLRLAAKQAHWNVRGATFGELHELFDKVAEAANEWADEMAERAVQLGAIAEGTTAAVAKATNLKPYPLAITAADAHVSATADMLAAFGDKVRASIGIADEAGDPVTADLLTEISAEADKYLWMVEAHAG